MVVYFGPQHLACLHLLQPAFAPGPPPTWHNPSRAVKVEGFGNEGEGEGGSGEGGLEKGDPAVSVIAATR